MTRTIFPSKTGGTVDAIASKSVAHRLLICAAFAREQTRIECEQINEDIAATVRCLEALGAKIQREGSCFSVTPMLAPTSPVTLDCGESGSTLRFLVPIVAMLGIDASFLMCGRLPQRPLSPLREELTRHGITLSPAGSNPLTVAGKLQSTDFSIAGNVSSQFISGLLLAISLTGTGGTVQIDGPLESAPYLDLTIDALSRFGVQVIHEADRLTVAKGQVLLSPRAIQVEGDWSNAAFPLALGVLGNAPVTVRNLSPESKQGDRAIVSLLREFGATLVEHGDQVTALPSSLHGISIDASQVPDLVPILATVASVAEGETVIHHASRLRIKESDRLRAVSSVLSGLGASVRETDDGLILQGVSALKGGQADAFGDHRIAMSVAIASGRCQNPILLSGSEATAKSYPDFWRDCTALGLLCPKS